MRRLRAATTTTANGCSDGANVQLANAVPAGGGFDVTNPSDGARYEVRPDHLTIYSNGHVDSAEPALEYASD